MLYVMGWRGRRLTHGGYGPHNLFTNLRYQIFLPWEALMRLLPETIARHKTRERCSKPLTEKGDARRYPTHTLAPDPQQPELQLEKPDE